MNITSITQEQSTVNFLYFIATDATDYTQLLDGTYPFKGEGEDQWVVVIGGQAVNWARDWGTAAMMEIEALRIAREHAGRNPDYIPFDGSPAPGNDNYDYGLQPVA